MRILFVLDYFYPSVGGVPTLFMYLAKELIARGHEVTVLTSMVTGARAEETYQGMKIKRVGTGRWSFMLKAGLHLLKSNDKYDIIQTSTYSAMVPSFFASALRHIPSAVVVHEVWSLKEMLEFYGMKGVLYFIEQRILLRLPFDKKISPSMHTKYDMKKQGVREGQIAVIPHGIDSGIFSPKAKSSRTTIRRKYRLKESDIVCAFVSKPTIFKGIDYLIDAIKMVNSNKINVKFIFMLSPLYKSQHRQLVDRINSDQTLKQSIVIAGYTNKHDYVARVVGASDFLVMPSLTEGFGFAAAEAASIGVPVIITNHTSMTEVVNSRNALIVEPRDTDGLADAIMKMTDGSVRSKLSHPKKFSDWGHVTQVYEALYKQIIKKHYQRSGDVEIE